MGGVVVAMDDEIVCESSADSLPEMSEWEFLNDVPDLPLDIDLQEDEPWIQSDGESDRQAFSGFRRRWKRAQSSIDDPLEGHLGDSEFSDHRNEPGDPAVDVGGRSSNVDDNIAVSNAFIDRNKQSGIVLPWENPMLSAIFGDGVPSPSLGMPSTWCADVMNQQTVDDGVDDMLKAPLQRGDVASCIKNVVDRPYLAGREVDMRNAVGKLHFILGIDFSCSEVGRHLMEQDADPDLILKAIMGTKSPATIAKRANAILQFYRWHALSLEEDFLPLREGSAWLYLQELLRDGAAPTKASSFMSGLRFAHYVLQIHGAKQCIDSRRLVGAAELMLSNKRATKQARPLTVGEMKRLHTIAADSSEALNRRVIASHLLLMAYGRCRNSDLVHVSDVMHDTAGGSALSGSSGYMQVSTRHHKSARSAASKTWLLPIVVSGEGVGAVPWLDMWIACRKQAGLPVSGTIDGALLPAPVGSGWAVRPVTCSETGELLRMLLSVEDGSVSSHSLKSTCLSWAAKAGMPRESRRLLGRHADAVQSADSFYSRDLIIGPLRELQCVIRWVREGLFHPDNNRAEYFPSGHPTASASTPGLNFQPKTPAFMQHGVVQKMSDPIVAVAMAEAAPASPAVKEEVMASVSIDEVIEIESDDTDSSTSTSNPEDASSGEDEVEAAEAFEPGCEPLFNEEKLHALARHCKSKIIHTIPSLEPFSSDSKYENSELMQNKFTACGRNVSKFFEPCRKIIDWTAKCRLCFRGRRQPPKG